MSQGSRNVAAIVRATPVHPESKLVGRSHMFVDACAAAVACCTSWKSLPMDALIESIDPRGRIIVLSVQQWVTHILPEHAELLGRETEIHVALKYPDIIASDIDHAARESY